MYKDAGLENCENLYLRQGEAIRIEECENGDKIVTTALEQKYTAKAIVFATGVYLQSRIIITHQLIGNTNTIPCFNIIFIVS